MHVGRKRYAGAEEVLDLLREVTKCIFDVALGRACRIGNVSPSVPIGARNDNQSLLVPDGNDIVPVISYHIGKRCPLK